MASVIKLTATANPQEYFEGAEPKDLRICVQYSIKQFAQAVKFAEQCCLEGYTVILTWERDPDG